MSARMASAGTARAGTLREHSATFAVTLLGAAFGSALVHATNLLSAIIVGSDLGALPLVRVQLAIVSSVFIAISVYVGAIVTANTFTSVIAGRIRQIALLRLIGATASSVRRAVALEGLVVGVVGAITGALVGTGIAGVGYLVATSTIGGAAPGAMRFTPIEPMVLLPSAVVALTTWCAAWLGTKGVSRVSPIAALGVSVEAPHSARVRRPVRTVLAALFLTGGGLLLATGVHVGFTSPLGLPVAFLGGIGSFTGIVLGAHLVIPPALEGLGRVFGRSPVATQASRNAIRHADRSTRACTGLLIGVTLVTCLVVASSSFQSMLLAAADREPEAYAGADVTGLIATITAVFAGMIGFSVLIAGLGMANTLRLGVLQRVRELGLLRALGFTKPQVRSMVLLEGAQLAITATVLGLLLGTAYGWAGAQSMLGSVPGGGWLPPSVPLWLLCAVLVGSAALIVLASLAPARLAGRASPIEAISAT